MSPPIVTLTRRPGESGEDFLARAQAVGDAGPPRFLIRSFPVSATGPAEDEAGGDNLTDAIAYAQSKAYDPAYRTVMVIDVFMTCWAQFNMLWSAK